MRIIVEGTQLWGSEKNNYQYTCIHDEDSKTTSSAAKCIDGKWMDIRNEKISVDTESSDFPKKLQNLLNSKYKSNFPDYFKLHEIVREIDPNIGIKCLYTENRCQYSSIWHKLQPKKEDLESFIAHEMKMGKP